MATYRDAFTKEMRIVGGTSRNESKTLGAFGDGRKIAHLGKKDDAVISFRLFGKFGKLGASWSSSACVYGENIR
jgi:hypothetical protein